MHENITEKEMLKRFQPGNTILPPLVIRACETGAGASERNVDALVDLALPDASQFRFVVEIKARVTLESVQAAAAQAKMAARENEWPMIQVPYLAPDRLKYLEDQEISGVDLCGNGVVIVPQRRLWVFRSGQPNQYRDSRPVHNPFRGRSALVARTLLTQRFWPSLRKMVQSIRKAGGNISMAQASKAVRALEEELLVGKLNGTINSQDAPRLLDMLGSEWRYPSVRARRWVRLADGDKNWAARLSAEPQLRWAITGGSSVPRYAVFSQGGPQRVAVSDLPHASAIMGGTSESVPNFADVELIETEEPGFFYQCVNDEAGIHWGSRLQTWLELQGGDARQQEAARELRSQILKSIQS